MYPFLTIKSSPKNAFADLGPLLKTVKTGSKLTFADLGPFFRI